MGSKKQQVKEAEQTETKTEQYSSSATPAEVVEIVGTVNSKQGGTQVRCKLVSGSEEGKVMRRNVYGPVRIGDILLLRETEIEAAPMRGRKG